MNAHPHLPQNLIFKVIRNLVPRDFVPLNQRSENESSRSRTISGMHHSVISFDISKWLLPRLSFSDHWSRGTKTLGTRLGDSSVKYHGKLSAPDLIYCKGNNCRFSHDVTKIQTTKLLILIFYFNDV